MTEGYSGSDIANFVADTVLQPIRELEIASYWRRTGGGCMNNYNNYDRKQSNYTYDFTCTSRAFDNLPHLLCAVNSLNRHEHCLTVEPKTLS